MPEQAYNIVAEALKLLASIYPPSFIKEPLDDTTLVLMATSTVDDFLKLVLIAGFNNEVISRRKLDDVFTGHGPLATFSAKISVAAMLGLTTANVRHDLPILRKIRNDFAHSRHELYLRDMRGCLALKTNTKMEVKDNCAARKRFKEASLGIIGNLSTATVFKTAQARFLRNNRAGVADEYSRMTSDLAIDDPSPDDCRGA